MMVEVGSLLLMLGGLLLVLLLVRAVVGRFIGLDSRSGPLASPRPLPPEAATALRLPYLSLTPAGTS
ncbi:hypothetical protein CTI14_54305, partial [Methylobacterium radiotolerans]